MSFPAPFYRWRPHPWHGIEAGPNPPQVVHAYILNAKVVGGFQGIDHDEHYGNH